MVVIEDVREWAKYVIRADGKGDEPHFVSILITDPEVAIPYDGNTAYRIIVSSIRAILADSVDKPPAIEFPDSGKRYRIRPLSIAWPNYILEMKAGRAFRIIRSAERASCFLYIYMYM